MTEVISKNIADVVHLQPDFSGLIFEIVINRGSEHQVKLGDKYIIFGYGPNLKDPVTGEDLGTLELVRGQGQIIHIQPKMSIVRSTSKQIRQGRRVHRKNIGGILALHGATEETEIPEPTDLPFENVAIKDKARLISSNQ